MKNFSVLFIFTITAFIALQTSSYAQYTPPQPVDTGFVFGVNWSINVGNGVFSDSLQFNNFQTGDSLTPTLLNTILPHGTFTYADYGDKNIIYPYSKAQQLLYSTVPKPLPGDLNASDTLKRFYFLHMDSTIGYSYFGSYTLPYEWEVDSSSDSSFSNVIVMSQNEMGGEWTYTPDTLLLAVRLQVPVIKGLLDSDRIVASVIIKFDTWRLGDTNNPHPRDTSYTSETFNIMWSWFVRPNTDTCFFSPLYAVPSNFQCYQNGDPDWDRGTEITLMSQRYVSFRVSKIVITDQVADALISGLPPSTPLNLNNIGYDSENVVRQNISDSIALAIKNSAYSVDSILGSRRKYFYLLDEMDMSNFAASRATNMALDTTGTCEMERPWVYNRYIAQVQPKAFIYPFFAVGDNNRSAYSDTGRNNYNIDTSDTSQRIADYDNYNSSDTSAVGHTNVAYAWNAGTNALFRTFFQQYGTIHWWGDLLIAYVKK